MRAPNKMLHHALLTSLLLITAACGEAPPATGSSPSDDGARLPRDRQVIDVPVTRPADPQPVEVQDLPPTARAVGQMPGLSAEEKLCANHAIKLTLDADPSIRTTNAKMASVLGNSIVACTPPARLANIVGGGVASSTGSLSDEQRACLERTITDDPPSVAHFLSALLTLDLDTVTSASEHFEKACGMQVAPG